MVRIIAFITHASVIDQFLTHLRSRADHAGARSPLTLAPASRGASRAGRPPVNAPTAAPPTLRDHAGTFGVRGRPTAASP